MMRCSSTSQLYSSFGSSADGSSGHGTQVKDRAIDETDQRDEGEFCFASDKANASYLPA